MMRRLKKAMLQDPIVLAAPMQTRLENRPFTKTILSPGGFKLDTVQKVALALLIIPTALGFVASIFSANWVLVGITGFLFLLCALMFWVIHLRSGMLWKVTWYPNIIEVEDGRYGKAETWREPIAAFRGLQRDFALIPRANQYAPNRRVHGLLLLHPDPYKSILLHASHEPIGEEIVNYYAHHLDKTLLNN
jgi:hypothetical protein